MTGGLPSSANSTLLRALIALIVGVFPASLAADPLTSPPAWTFEGDLEGAWLGVSVGTAGDVNGDGFSDVIVGAYLYDNGQLDEGRAFVFHGSASGLSTTPAWTAESNQDSSWFGYSVGTAGDVNGDGFDDVIVGAWQYSNGESQEGKAFVYLGSAGGLATSPAWTAEGNQLGVGYGISVGTAGDVNDDGFDDVVVGAWHYGNGQNHEGRAFVYHGSAAGLATSPSWTAESNQDAGYFGITVGTAGDVNGDGFSDVIVGSYGYDNGETQEGRAFVFHGSAMGLAASAAWTFESNHGGAYLGSSVGTAGDVNSDGFSDVVVGALQYNNGQASEGRAYAFLGSAAGLANTPIWAVEGNQIGAHLGISSGTAGDMNGDGFSDVIVGAFLYNNGLGEAFVYHGSSGGLPLSPSWTPESPNGGGQVGISVGTAGDVNGDGISDVIVGAWEFSDEEFEEGRALVFHGSRIATSVGAAETVGSGRALLDEPAPNPFAGETVLRYTLAVRANVRLAIYDVAGRLVARLTDGVEDAGPHITRWNGRSGQGAKLPPGAYLARLESAGRIEARKIVLVGD